MGTGREAHEILEFVLEKQEWQEDSGKRYELYIIHHCHSDAASNCIKWQKVQFGLFSLYKSIRFLSLAYSTKLWHRAQMSLRILDGGVIKLTLKIW